MIEGGEGSDKGREKYVDETGKELRSGLELEKLRAQSLEPRRQRTLHQRTLGFDSKSPDLLHLI